MNIPYCIVVQLDFVTNALEGPGKNSQPSVRIGKVAPSIISGLRRFGIYLREDAYHELSDNNVRHMRNKKHGIHNEGPRGITDGDIYAIPYIIANADGAYYSTTKTGKPGVLYVMNDNDSTYYVEGIPSDGVLTGRQMIKAPRGIVPDLYVNDVVKEKALTASPDDLKIPGGYVQDVTRSRAFEEIIPSMLGETNPPARNSLDDDYMPLAERYDAGIATEAEIAQIRRDVETAADDAGFPSVEYDPVIYDANGEIVPLSERFDPDFAGNRYSVDDDLDYLIKKYGAMPQGREAIRGTTHHHSRPY